MSKMGRRRKIAGDTQKSLMKKALKAHSLYIRNRDKWTCFVCGFVGDKYSIDNGHLISRRKKAVLFDDMNCHAQCKGCNKLHNYEPHHYTQRFIWRYGQEAYGDLIEGSLPLKHWTAPELQELIDHYTNALNELGGTQ